MRSAAPVKHSIILELVAGLSLSLLLGVLVAFAIQSRISRAPIEVYLANKALDLSRAMSENLAIDVWNLDKGAIGVYFSGSLWNHLGIQSVRILTEFDDVLYARQWSDGPEPVFHRQPVSHNGKVIGYVEVFVSKEPLHVLQNALRQMGVTMSALTVGSVLIVSLILVRLIIIRPLRRTMAGLRKIAGGDYGFRLPRGRTSEMDSINQEINTMSAEILSHRKQLESEIAFRRKAEQDLSVLNKDLDRRVKGRTRQLRHLAGRLASAQDAEQRRIAEGLHDDVAQLLAAARMKLQMIPRCHHPEKARLNLAETDELLSQAHIRLRNLSFELASSTLSRLGLKVALEELCEGMSKRYPVSFALLCELEPGSLPDETATLLFKSVRELLFNVAKHAEARTARVVCSRDQGAITLIVEDDGQGFEAPPDADHLRAGSGLGLFGIRERVRDLGGMIRIESEPGQFTRVTLTLPILEEDEK